MSKKYTIIRDELNLKGGGLYCYLPFGNLDKHHKAIFKVGLAMNFNSRTEQYHTYFEKVQIKLRHGTEHEK